LLYYIYIKLRKKLFTSHHPGIVLFRCCLYVYCSYMADKVSATRNLHPFLGIFVDEKNVDKKMKDMERYTHNTLYFYSKISGLQGSRCLSTSEVSHSWVYNSKFAVRTLLDQNCLDSLIWEDSSTVRIYGYIYENSSFYCGIILRI
jgi:hypothetical protein